MPLVWIFYIIFEIKNNSFDNVKRIFYRSVNSCSWSKNLWKLLLKSMRPFFTESEMTELFELMIDRGIHLRKQ